MRKRALLVLAALALMAPGCGSKDTAPRQEQRPASSEETREAILAAVDNADYGALRALIDPASFLSDFGFGEERDPVGRWEEMGSEPLETMDVLLQMESVVRETNEGTLHQWPGYDADSEPGDLTAEDRARFETVMSKDELDRLITDEYGYTGPKLGILADGTWWFFVLEGRP
jgi:hypothetical protein